MRASDNVEQRRIYIHQDSYSYLACQSDANAEAVYRALCHARLVRVALHHIIDNGCGLGLIRPNTCVKLSDYIKQSWGVTITIFLRSVVYRSGRGESGTIQPVLTAPEVVEATCFESGYFTYATGPDAARRMYDDTAPLRQLRRNYARNDQGDDRDLVLIRGWSLLRKTQLDEGASRTFRRPVKIDTAGLISRQRAAAMETRKEFEANIRSFESELSLDETRIVQGLVRVLRGDGFISTVISTPVRVAD